MKLLPKITPPIKTNANASEPLGHGFDAAIVVALFFGLGWVIDYFLGTTPIFMIALTIVGAIGVFLRFWYLYDEKMAQHEAERAEKSAAQAAARRKIA